MVVGAVLWVPLVEGADGDVDLGGFVVGEDGSCAAAAVGVEV